MPFPNASFFCDVLMMEIYVPHGPRPVLVMSAKGCMRLSFFALLFYDLFILVDLGQVVLLQDLFGQVKVIDCSFTVGVI